MAVTELRRSRAEDHDVLPQLGPCWAPGWVPAGPQAHRAPAFQSEERSLQEAGLPGWALSASIPHPHSAPLRQSPGSKGTSHDVGGQHTGYLTDLTLQRLPRQER